MYSKNNNSSMKRLREYIHGLRFFIIGGITILAIILILRLVQTDVWGYFLAIITAIFLIIFLMSLIRQFSTTHNRAQLGCGDSLLEKTYQPGELILLLPTYYLVEHKGNQILDTNELSFTINNEGDDKGKKKKMEVQFMQHPDKNPEGKDSVDAGNINVNYFFNKNKTYDLLMIAPENYEAVLEGNIKGDIAKAFKNRIATLEEAQEFTDLIYIDPDNPRDDIETPDYVKEAGFYIYIDESEQWPSFIIDKKGDAPKLEKLYVPELNSTLERARNYGIDLQKIDIEGFEDSKKTDDLRNSVKQQEFINEKLGKENAKTLALIDEYFNRYKDLFDHDVAMDKAREDVARLKGTHTSIATDKNATVMLNTSNKNKL